MPSRRPHWCKYCPQPTTPSLQPRAENVALVSPSQPPVSSLNCLPSSDPRWEKASLDTWLFAYLGCTDCRRHRSAEGLSPLRTLPLPVLPLSPANTRAPVSCNGTSTRSLLLPCHRYHLLGTPETPFPQPSFSCSVNRRISGGQQRKLGKKPQF